MRPAASELSRQSIRKYVLDLRLRVSTNELPSGSQQPLKTLAHLLVGEVGTALQSLFATPHCVMETAFLVEITCHDLPHKLVGITTLLSGRLRQLRFELWCEMHFHSI